MLRFLSKLVLICNGCFLVSVIMRYVERRAVPEAGSPALSPLPFYFQWMLILGMVAVLLNLLFLLLCGVYVLTGKALPVSRWLLWVNGLFFLFELLYYLS